MFVCFIDLDEKGKQRILPSGDQVLDRPQVSIQIGKFFRISDLPSVELAFHLRGLGADILNGSLRVREVRAKLFDDTSPLLHGFSGAHELLTLDQLRLNLRESCL